MKDATVPSMPTVGEIARRLKQPVWRIEYVIRTRNLTPSTRAANLRIFTEADVDFIASEMRRIDRDKEGGLG